MRKKQFKHYLQCGILLLGIPLLLTNCEKEFTEDITHQESSKSKFKVSTLNEKQIESDASISYELREIKEASQRNDVTKSSSREIYNEDYGFTINTDFVKKIEDAETGNHSYSFPIVRDNPTTENLENLLLHSNVDGEYDAYIVHYDFTSKEYVNFNENTVTDFNTILTPIDFDTGVFGDGVLSKLVYGCSESWVYTTYTEHENGEVHGVNSDGTCAVGCNFGTSEWLINGISCGYYDDGTGGSDNGGDTGTSTGGGSSTGGGTNGSQDPNYDPTDPDIHGNGSNNNGPVIAAPAPTEPLGTGQKKRYLKKLMENPTISQKMGELSTKLNTDLLEDGARFKYISDDNYEIRLPSQRKGSGLVYAPPYKPREVVSGHMHQKESRKYLADGTPSDELFPNSPIFSDGDVVEFLDNLEYIESTDPELTEDVTSLMITLKPNTVDYVNLFALVVNNGNDKEKALDAQEALLNIETYDKFLDEFKKEVLEDWELETCDDTCVIDKFVNFIMNYEINGQTLGISIYQYNIDSNGNVNWIKL